MDIFWLNESILGNGFPVTSHTIVARRLAKLEDGKINPNLMLLATYALIDKAYFGPVYLLHLKLKGHCTGEYVFKYDSELIRMLSAVITVISH